MKEFERLPSRLVIHCSATDDGPKMDSLAIKDYHLSLGWDDIGYHFLLEKVGGKLMLVRGRSPRYEGAHCRAAGRNHDSIGFCIVGDFDEEPPSQELFNAAAKAVALICFAYGIPSYRVSAHREWELSKTCPGKRFDMVLFRDAIDAYLEAYHALGVEQRA